MIHRSLHGQPWHIRPAEFRALTDGTQVPSVIQPGANLAPISFRPVIAQSLRSFSQLADDARPIVGPTDEDGEPLFPQMSVIGDTAIIPVYGTLVRDMGVFDMIFGAMPYAFIAQMCQQAIEDSTIAAVIFDFNSPGGMTAGCAECARSIALVSEAKNTFAFTEGMCCSAAYWLASACRTIVATPSAQVGNIGTIITAADESEAWKMQGLKLEIFASSEDKAQGATGKQWTDRDRAYMLERMEQADAMIQGSIRANRPKMLPEAANGRWYFAALPEGAPGLSGEEVGLVDFTIAGMPELLELLFPFAEK